ncbi:MAG: diguanylate cyclase [Acidaminococcaceae bacterium]
MDRKIFDKLLSEWQEIVDLTASVAGVPVGLIMHLCGNDFEVLVSSKTEGNSYYVGEKCSLFGSGLYCEQVIESQEKLLVPNALKSEKWRNNPDIKYNMIAYIGFPIRLPDGEPFGTICLLDCKENNFSHDIVALVEKMRTLIEEQLKMNDLLKQNVKQVGEIREKNSQLEKLNHALKLSDEKYRFITDNTLDFIWVYNINKKKFVYASPGVERIGGYSSKEVLAQGINGVVTTEFRSSVNQRIEEAVRLLQTKQVSEYISKSEIKQPCVDGGSVWVEYNVKYRFNESDEIEAVGVSRNIEERKRKEQEIYYFSTHDYLTSAYNRAHFFKRSNEEIKKTDSYPQPLTMMFLDLDYFKQINDRHGHAVGDEVLKNIARLISSILREDDVFARYGGEEFVVLMPGVSFAAACSTAEKIRNAVENENMSLMIKMTISIGVTEREANESLDDWLKRTDSAMYQAKANGRNCVICSKSRIFS